MDGLRDRSSPPGARHSRARESSIDSRTIELVQASWAKVRPISDAAATLFYDRLFSLDPSVKPLFKHDMGEQKKKLMQTLGVAVDGLNAPDKLIPVLQQLGVRHAGYMVQEHHYDRVGEALLWTLGEGLGDGFTPEVEAAWTRVYGFVADVMKSAAARNVGGGADLGTLRYPGAPGRIKPPERPIPPAAANGASPAWSSAPAARPAASAGGLPDEYTIALVQASWAKVRPISDAAATLFYDRLFELDPSVRPLFKNDMGEQKKKLMQTLTVAVDGLRAADKLIPVLEDLGVRHAGYMVQDHHYDRVGEALLWTLGEGLGDGFTPEVRAAWTEVYGLIAGVMKRAAAGQPSLAAAPARRSVPAPAASPAFAAPASTAEVAPVSPPPARTEGMAIPSGAVIPVRLEGSELTIRAVLESSREPEATSRPPGGVTIAVLLAIACGAAVVMATSVALFSVADLAAVASRVPTPVLYLLPLSAAVLAVATFMLGYLWGLRGRPPNG